MLWIGLMQFTCSWPFTERIQLKCFARGYNGSEPSGNQTRNQTPNTQFPDRCAALQQLLLLSLEIGCPPSFKKKKKKEI